MEESEIAINLLKHKKFHLLFCGLSKDFLKIFHLLPHLFKKSRVKKKKKKDIPVPRSERSLGIWNRH